MKYYFFLGGFFEFLFVFCCFVLLFIVFIAFFVVGNDFVICLFVWDFSLFLDIIFKRIGIWVRIYCYRFRVGIRLGI